ncbi:MAG: hypothetical protein EA401_06325 [Planctomycetota bacterium]|nr:MAG: hypothetical protein EA401_06325 [Planctomycetota bacterium]
MNTAIKVFIILNLLLALGFAYMQMLTYATRENWKRRWDQDTRNLAEELVAANRSTAIASHDKAVAEAATARAQNQIQGLTQTIEDQKSRLDQREADVVNLNLRISKQDEQIQAQILQIQNLNETLATTRQRNSELNNIAAVARAVAHELDVRLAELEDDFNNAQVELRRREQSIARMEEDINRKDARLALVRERHRGVYDEITSDEPPSAEIIEGMVAAIHNDPSGRQDLVMITVGRNADIRPNMEFIILRGDQYIVKVRVDRVLDDMAACRVIPETWNTRGHTIQQGDLVQNRLW